MKKFLSLLMTCCFFSSILMNPIRVHADEITPASTDSAANESVAETAAESAVPEGPVILPTDQLSTEDIILYSSAACVMDVDTGDILYSKNMDDRHYPASTTKVLTSLIALESAPLTNIITYSDACWEGVNFYTDTSVGMLNGEQLTVEDSVYAMLLVSANEVCNQIGDYISGSQSAFADLMNTRAAELGCTNSHFTNPNGLHDDNHYTTAHDLAIIARAAIQNPSFRKITGSYDYTVASTNMRPEGFTISNSHQMLMYTKYHYNACIGGKTGYTTEASNTLITFAEKDGHTLACVVMENADGHIYPDTIEVLDYCFDHYSELISAAETDSAETALRLPFIGFGNSLSQYAFGAVGIPYASGYLSAAPNGTESESVAIHLQDQPVLGTAVTQESSYPVRLSQKIIPLIIKKPLIAIPLIIVSFAILTLLIVWLKGAITRMYHRHRYKKLRHKRIHKS